MQYLFSKRQLQLHNMTYHEGQKNFKCESCGKSFSEAGKLKKHIHTVHEGHKDYKCESCGKSFSQEGNWELFIFFMHRFSVRWLCF